jgi:phosphate-selective porin OprO/OprP
MQATRWRKPSGVLVLALAAGLTAVGATSAQAPAQDPVLLEMKARLERLEKQNEDLRQRLETASPAAYQPQNAPAKEEKEKINSMIDAYMKDKEAKKKAEEDAKVKKREEEGYKVGSETNLSVKWNLDQGLLFETPNRDFTMHVGFFAQWDTVALTSSKILQSAGQVGELSDGTFFRRIRPLWDGNAWGFAEWNVILALEQIGAVSAPNGTPAGNGNALINLDEVWAGVYGIPIIGRIRMGHLKVNQGFEGNQFSSSRAMQFNENAAYTDAFYTIFGTGVQILNSALDDGRGDRVTWQAMMYRDDFSQFGNTGAFFGSGEWCYTGRVTALLLADCEDRHLLHVGLSDTYRKAQNPINNAGTGEGVGISGPATVRFRARPELRDAIGGFGDASTLPGDTGRLVDTGNIVARGVNVLGTELVYFRGPFSVQAEYAFATMLDAQVPVTVGRRTGTIEGDRNFNGGYASVSYFLTGETRKYDRNFGREFTFYVERPFTNAFAKNTDDGPALGWGAWEVCARASYINLNDGPIGGGIFAGYTIGLNWYLNSNLKIQCEYIHNERYDKGSLGTVTGGGSISGKVDGFGTRMQFQF